MGGNRLFKDKFNHALGTAAALLNEGWSGLHFDSYSWLCSLPSAQPLKGWFLAVLRDNRKETA